MRQEGKGFAAHLHLLYFVSFPVYDSSHANLSLHEVSHFATVNRLDSLKAASPPGGRADRARTRALLGCILRMRQSNNGVLQGVPS